MRYNRKCKMAYLLGFNNNIRCIEIPINAGVPTKPPAFNNNIRCIEMFVNVGADGEGGRFNNNIRCIEIDQKLEIHL